MVKVPVGETTAPVTLLFNPERVRSTAAKVDAASVAARPCFLCARNRPAEQLVQPGLHDLGYDILVNPYPILSPHYTIVARAHEPQLLPMQAMLTAAERFPDLVFFSMAHSPELRLPTTSISRLSPNATCPSSSAPKIFTSPT